MNNNYNLDHSEIRKIAGLGSISAPACFATAGTALIVGFVPKCSFQQQLLLLDFLEICCCLFRDSGSFWLFFFSIFVCATIKEIIYGYEFHKLFEYKRIKVVVHVPCEMLIKSDTFSHGYHCIFDGVEIVCHSLVTEASSKRKLILL